MYVDRRMLEEEEERRLAPYAVKSRESRGREYPESEHDYRTAFQRDRDRIIHTTAFRRLRNKTQVFIPLLAMGDPIHYEGDYYRTRLSHTLEAAQIGRTMARALGLNEDLVETIALAHDLGHTPFGHAGEVALNELMADQGGFNHNMQSLRIVTVLEERYPDFPGLNLTWEVREGIVKHVTEYDTTDAAGYEPELHPTLEAQLVSLADEIAYNTHDLDDGLRSGLITPQQLMGLSLWERAVRATEIDMTHGLSEFDRRRVVRYLVNAEVTDVIQATAARLDARGIRSVEDVRTAEAMLAGHSDEMTAENRELKDFLLRNLYRHYRVMRMQVKGQRIVTDLFRAYQREPTQLPPGIQARLGTASLEQVICDYIAGMTDRFAVEEYRSLFEAGARA
ncbi:MAG: deoxyguanosinetriphosphate triphosphohydrolase [Chloroflexi bacterium]|nr:deoxyguanosinetriphosphate triphosphohydrolase [Chloroflexota bacterium]